MYLYTVMHPQQIFSFINLWLGGQGQGLMALGKFVKKSFFVQLGARIAFIHGQGWVPSFFPYLVHQDLSPLQHQL
jgi:hypothetical protein